MQPMAMFRDAWRRAWPVLALVVPLGLASLLATHFGSLSLQSSVTLALIRIVMVVGMYVFIGNSGIVSFGHAAFMAVAAYAAAWQTCCEALKPIVMSGLPDFLLRGSQPLWTSMATSVAAATLAALLVGLVLMRLSGLAASISTLAVLFILNVVYSNWDSVTMGTASIVGLPTFMTPPLAFGAAAFSIVVAYAYQRSRWGLVLRAAREDEVAASASGVSLYGCRLIAFTLSGAIVGVAGVLQAHFVGTISVDSFFLNLTFICLAMLVVGGMRSLAGAVVGVVFVQSIIEVFRVLEGGIELGGAQFSLPGGTQELVLAAAMLLILIFRREGLMGGRELTWPSRNPRALPTDAETPRFGPGDGFPARTRSQETGT